MGQIPRAEPDAKPRIAFGAEAKRDRPIFELSSSSPAWKVEVVPLPDVTTEGRPLTGGGSRPRAMFEVRVEYHGKGMDAFEPVEGGVKQVDSWTTRDLELAKAVAMIAVDELRAGREPVLVKLVGRFRRLRK